MKPRRISSSGVDFVKGFELFVMSDQLLKEGGADNRKIAVKFRTKESP